MIDNHIMTEARKQFVIRLSDTERALVNDAAKIGGETTSNWVRRTILAAARKEVSNAQKH